MSFSRKKIGIVFLDFPHHILHFSGIAASLSANPDIQLDILTHSIHNAYLQKILDICGAKNSTIRNLKTSRYGALRDWMQKRAVPRKLFIVRKNIPLFLEYDALIFTGFEHNLIWSARKNNTPVLICTFHGAGDRAYGFGINGAKFDLLLLSGEKIKNRLEEAGVLHQNNSYRIIGYPKLDVVKKINPSIRFFDNNKPIVLYNPHFVNKIGSWKKLGIEVLEFFSRHPEYNLLFAPHFNLFKQNNKDTSFLDNYKKYPNILIDTGSEHSVEMSYTLAADVYLGDVSSQVYEFLLTPKPVFYLNAHLVDWQDNPDYFHWQLGDVLTEVGQLEEKLKNRNEIWKNHYEAKQKEIMDYTFQINPEKESSQRAADAIVAYLDDVLV